MATKADSLKLVISQDFEKKYEKCLAKSCVKTEHLYQLQFYRDNHCMIATLEDNKGEIYGRVILWGCVYFRTYVKKGYQRAFTTWLKRAGMKNGKDLYVTYPIIRIQYLPYIDYMKYFNLSLSKLCNKNTEDFVISRSWETEPNIKLLQALYYSCPECDGNTNLRLLPENEGRIYCPQCHAGKYTNDTIQIFEEVETVDWKDGFEGDVPYTELRSGIENELYRPIIEGEYKKLVIDVGHPKGIYK